MPKIAKVPVIMQMEALECGAASLCMILAHYGKWIPLEKVRSDCGVSRDGSNALNILKAARSYGLKANGFRMRSEDVKNVKFPAIIFWNRNHFVVLNGFKKNKVVINDPARGTLQITFEEFNQCFSELVLQFEKEENFKPEGKPRSVWGFAKKRLHGTAPEFVLIMLTGILTSLIGILPPLFTRIFMDNILSGKNLDWLTTFILAMILMIISKFIVDIIEGIYWLKIQGKLSIEANSSFMWHVLRLPVEFFTQRFAGDIVLRQSSNETISYDLIGKLAPVFMNAILVIFYVVVMLKYSVILSLVGISAALINIIIMRGISKKRVNMSRILQSASGKLSGATMAGFGMIETIKAAGAENGFFGRWSGYFALSSNAKISLNKANQYLSVIPTLLQSLANTVILMIGVYLILDGDFTIGMLMAFQGFLSSFLSPINQIIDVGKTFIEMRTQIERVEDVFNYNVDVDDNEQNIITEEMGFKKLSGRINISNLTFGYNKLSEPLIENLSLNVKPGGSVALVGNSGSGKSTIAKLVSGLYKPWSGEIKFDGLEKSEINRSIFTSSMAVVDQDIILFEDTIKDNITLWDKSIDETVYVSACKDAQIHETIMERDEGYSHVIKEDGKNFSGGQRQRFEIARALAMEPSIIILDEATSALDAKTEQLIMEAVKKRKITLIIVAHRLSTIRDCDEIIVLNNGKVVERGNHESLLKLNGQYARLIEST